MKLRKALLLTTMTAAIASMNMFAAFADTEVAVEDQQEEAVVVTTDQESLKTGWDGSGSVWRYYDENGNLVSGWIPAEGGDGRGNEVWYYIDPATMLMVYNETRVIDGVSYSFGEDGSWVAPYVTAPKGKLTGGSFFNTWSNIKIPQVIGSTNTDYEAEDQFAGASYASIGSPKLTHDLYMSTDFGDLEIFYLDMAQKPEMDAAAFAAELGNIEKGKTGTLSAVGTAAVGNQQYATISITKPGRRKASQTTYYCRKQDGYMVIICTSGYEADANAMADIVNTITTAQ